MNGANITSLKRTKKLGKIESGGQVTAQKGRVTGKGGKRERGPGGVLWPFSGGGGKGGDLDLTDNRQATSIAEQWSASLCQCVWAIRKKWR